VFSLSFLDTSDGTRDVRIALTTMYLNVPVAPTMYNTAFTRGLWQTFISELSSLRRATWDVQPPLQTKCSVSSWSKDAEEIEKGCQWSIPNLGMQMNTHCPAAYLRLVFGTENCTTGGRPSSAGLIRLNLAFFVVVKPADVVQSSCRMNFKAPSIDDLNCNLHYF
jgi:hypothetical protein